MSELKTLAGFQLDEVLPLVRSIGWGAADVLQAYYHDKPTSDGSSRDLDVKNKADGPVTAADVAANRYILERLQGALGTQDFYYLSEETYKSQAATTRLGYDWVWIIDPLDGTRDFIEKTGEYAIHIALAHQGRPVLAVVVCPERGQLYYASLGHGTFAETRDPDGSFHQRAIQVSSRNHPTDLTVVVSGSHRDERFNQLLRQFPSQNQRSVGSVGCKIATLLEQQADVYLALSGKSAAKDWDIAAPELVLTEAGGQWTRFDRTPLKYNQEDVSQWGGLLASNGHCHDALCDAAAKILAELEQS